jgi:VWFA-related protein
MQIPILILVLLASVVPAVEEDPADSGITERVDVQLVLLDVTVMDRKRELVMGLTRDDFVLRVDNRRVPIVSLDMDCPDGPVAEPPSVDQGTTESVWVAPDRERRVVFAVDYRHIPQTRRVEVLRDIGNAIRRLHRSNEQLMIVALTDFLRVELPPTTDGAAALATLERMENDITLWLPPFDHLHDAATFDALYDLTVMLGSLEEDKIVVLYSDWPSSGVTSDAAFEELTRAAARNRVSFYTVWTRGLRTRGTSRHLARLAVETGGRYSERTNDFSQGYARAQRDASCRYTLGFHDTPEDPDRTRFVSVKVARRGIQPHYHDHYAPADREAAPAEVARAALAWPGLFASETVRVELLPLRPASRKRWKTVFAVSGDGPSEAEVDVRARLRRGSTRWTRTDEKLKAPFSASQPIELRHGSYESTITAIYPGGDEPRSAASTVELPELTADLGWWHAQPLVLRSLSLSSAGLAEPGAVGPEDKLLEGTALEGHPLGARAPVLGRVLGGEGLSLLYSVCRYGTTESVEDVSVEITVNDGARRVFETDRAVRFASGKGVRCETLDEALPALRPGAYVATVRMRAGGGDDSTRTREFGVVEAWPAGAEIARPGSD